MGKHELFSSVFIATSGKSEKNISGEKKSFQWKKVSSMIFPNSVNAPTHR
jgi:hypothetical protein